MCFFGLYLFTYGLRRRNGFPHWRFQVGYIKEAKRGIGKWGRGETGSRDNGIVEVGVRFPSAPLGRLVQWLVRQRDMLEILVRFQ